MQDWKATEKRQSKTTMDKHETQTRTQHHLDQQCGEQQTWRVTKDSGEHLPITDDGSVHKGAQGRPSHEGMKQKS